MRLCTAQCGIEVVAIMASNQLKLAISSQICFSTRQRAPSGKRGTLAAKRVDFQNLSMKLAAHVLGIDQGMSLLASKRRCTGWHQRLRCISLYPEHQCRWPKISYRYSSHHHDQSIKKTRNIGIIAHIDAVSSLGNISNMPKPITYSVIGQNNDD